MLYHVITIDLFFFSCCCVHFEIFEYLYIYFCSFFRIGPMNKEYRQRKFAASIKCKRPTKIVQPAEVRVL